MRNCIHGRRGACPEAIEEASEMIKIDDIIKHDGDTWRVVSVGKICEDGKTYVHLASTTRGKHQRNGFYPVQICDWIEVAA